MRETTLSELKTHLDERINVAQNQPVVVRLGNRTGVAIVSMENYEKLRKLHIQELDDLCSEVSAAARVRGMNESVLNELLRD